MCLDRNATGIDPAKDIYDLEFVVDCFRHQAIPFELRSNFAKLLISLHINVNPQEELNLPDLTRIWDEVILPSKLVYHKFPIAPSLLALKGFVLNFFTDLKGTTKIWD